MSPMKRMWMKAKFHFKLHIIGERVIMATCKKQKNAKVVCRHLLDQKNTVHYSGSGRCFAQESVLGFQR